MHVHAIMGACGCKSDGEDSTVVPNDKISQASQVNWEEARTRTRTSAQRLRRSRFSGPKPKPELDVTASLHLINRYNSEFCF